LNSPSEAAGHQFVESIGFTDFLTSIPPGVHCEGLEHIRKVFRDLKEMVDLS
jgi:hypothetical protein